MSEALNVVGPENLRLAGQQRSQRRARQRNRRGAHGRLGAFSSLALMAATTAVLWPPDPAFGDALQEIVVTAQKRDQAAQDVPITVTVLTADALVASDSKDLFQLAGREVPVDKETGVRITGGWHPQESFDPILLGVPDVEFPRLDGLAGITIQVAGFLFTDSLAPNLGLECDADKGRPRGLLGPAHLVDEIQQPIVDSHLNSLHHCGSECGVESTL